MAKKLQEIYVDFTGRLGKLKAAMSRAKDMVKNSMATLGRIAKRGGMILGTALVAGLVMAVKAFISFEQQMAKVATMLDEATMHIIPKYARAIKDLAIKFGEGTASITEGLYQILSAGISVTGALKVLRASMMAAKAGFTDTATAAYALTGVMNAYGYAADKVGRVSDILFLIQKRGQTSFAQFAPVLGRVTSIAAAMGVKLEEVAAALAILTKSGISTAESITYLRGLIVSLAGRSKEGIEIAKEMGIELSAEALKRKGLSGMLKDLLPLSADVLKKIVSETEARTGLVVLLEKQAEFEQVLKEAMEASGLTMEAYGRVSETLGEKFKRLWESIKMFATDLGETFAPMIEKAVEAITKKFSDMRDELDAIWHGTDKDFKEFLNILLQLLATKMSQLASDMKVYGKLAADGFFSAFHDRAVEWNKKYMKWTYAVLHKQWEKEEAERERRLREGGKAELKASKEIADAKVKAILAPIEEAYKKRKALIAEERAEIEREEAKGVKEISPSLELKQIESDIKNLRRNLAHLKEETPGEFTIDWKAGAIVPPLEPRDIEKRIDALIVKRYNLRGAIREEAKEAEAYQKKAARDAQKFEEDRQEAIADSIKKERDARIEKLQKLRDMYRKMEGMDKKYVEVQKALLWEQAEEFEKTGLMGAKEAYARMVAKEERAGTEAAEAAKAGFVRFETAWGNIVSQLTTKRVEEQQLSELQKLVQKSEKSCITLEQVLRAIESGEGGFTI